jgi:hypothetical protein
LNVEVGSAKGKQTWLTQAIARLKKQEQRILFQAGEILRRLAQ